MMAQSIGCACFARKLRLLLLRLLRRLLPFNSISSAEPFSQVKQSLSRPQLTWPGKSNFPLGPVRALFHSWLPISAQLWSIIQLKMMSKMSTLLHCVLTHTGREQQKSSSTKPPIPLFTFALLHPVPPKASSYHTPPLPAETGPSRARARASPGHLRRRTGAGEWAGRGKPARRVRRCGWNCKQESGGQDNLMSQSEPSWTPSDAAEWWPTPLLLLPLPPSVHFTDRFVSPIILE